MAGSEPWPTEIAYNPVAKSLRVAFDNNRVFDLPAEYLRVESPSAEVQGHDPSQRQFVGGRMHVGIIGIEPVGNYAVRLLFDDMHDTGIYSWRYLYELGQGYAERWQVYTEGLKTRGLKRAP
jgi:DUF971 family protein